MKFPHIIGIAGKAQSGKDTVAEHISNLAVSEGDLYRIVPFARNVKKVANKLYDFSLDWCYSAEGKQRIVRGKTVRHWLQLVGETMRGVDREIWVNPVLNQALYEWKDYYWKTVIPDVRYLNEFSAIKKLGAINPKINTAIIKLVRLGEGGLTGEEAGHPSETELDVLNGSAFDAVFTAKSGDVSGLLNQVERWLEND